MTDSLAISREEQRRRLVEGLTSCADAVFKTQNDLVQARAALMRAEEDLRQFDMNI